VHVIATGQHTASSPPTARVPTADGHSSARPGGPPVARDLTLAYLASLLVAALMAVASAAGILLAPAGLYGRDPALVAVFAGQDAANLLVGLPILLGSVWLARRGSFAGLLLWPGALFFVLYTYALYLVGAPFNALFLLYVGLVVLSAYMTVGVVAGTDGDAVRVRLARAPARTVGGVLVGIGLLATAGLMAPVITALGDPSSVDPLLHARWVVDFAVGNPVLLIGGVLLWRRTGLGYATAAGLLFLSGVNGVAFAVGAALGALLTATPIDAAVIAVHLVIAAVCLALLAYFLRCADGSPTPSRKWGQPAADRWRRTPVTTLPPASSRGHCGVSPPSR
jgi:hypothetical protein